MLEFDIARQRSGYKTLLQSLPYIFVGESERLSHPQSHPSSKLPATAATSSAMISSPQSEPPIDMSHRSTTRPRGIQMRNYFYVSFFWFCTFALVKAGSSPQSNTDSRLDALFAIKRELGYHPLLAETWKGNNPCDKKWLGIHCVEGRIKYIVLGGKNLTGSISPRFADLTSVHVIDLSHNLLTGTIPLELTKMKLIILDLSHNQLHGKVPSFETLIPDIEGNPEIVTGVIRVPLQRGDKNTVGVGGFYVGIMVLGFLLIGGAGIFFYLAKKINQI